MQFWSEDHLVIRKFCVGQLPRAEAPGLVKGKPHVDQTQY